MVDVKSTEGESGSAVWGSVPERSEYVQVLREIQRVKG
jgi:hypothetical protein